MRKIGVVAAQIRGPHPRGRPRGSGVVFDKGHIDHAAEAGAIRPRRGRKRAAGVEHNAARVHIARVVISRREAPVIGRRARQGRELYGGVDGEGTGFIVSPEGEGEGATLKHVAAGHRLALAGSIELPGPGGQLGGAAHRSFNDEITGCIQGQAGGSVVAQGHAARVGAGGQQHVVFQVLTGVFVQRQVDARPQASVAQPPKRSHMGGPVAGIGSHEVVALTSCGRFGRKANTGAGLLKMHRVGVGRNAGRAGGRGGVAPRPAAVVMAENGRVQKIIGQRIVLHEKPPGRQGRLIAHAVVPLALVLNKLQAGRAGIHRGGPARSGRG